MRAALLTLVATITLMAAAVGLFWWAPWDADVREQAWLASVSEWTLDYYERKEPCERALGRIVGDPPT